MGASVAVRVAVGIGVGKEVGPGVRVGMLVGEDVGTGVAVGILMGTRVATSVAMTRLIVGVTKGTWAVGVQLALEKINAVMNNPSAMSLKRIMIFSVVRCAFVPDARHGRKGCCPPIPPQGVLRNASTFASANRAHQNAATVAEPAGKCSPFVRSVLEGQILIQRDVSLLLS